MVINGLILPKNAKLDLTTHAEYVANLVNDSMQGSKRATMKFITRYAVPA